MATSEIKVRESPIGNVELSAEKSGIGVDYYLVRPYLTGITTEKKFSNGWWETR